MTNRHLWTLRPPELGILLVHMQNVIKESITETVQVKCTHVFDTPYLDEVVSAPFQLIGRQTETPNAFLVLPGLATYIHSTRRLSYTSSTIILSHTGLIHSTYRSWHDIIHYEVYDLSLTTGLPTTAMFLEVASTQKRRNTNLMASFPGQPR